jgi:hypothetical protein
MKLSLQKIKKLKEISKQLILFLELKKVILEAVFHALIY